MSIQNQCGDHLRLHHTTATGGRLSSGQTNALFDELCVEDVDIDRHVDGLTAVVAGSLKGDSDPDREFHGDKIAFKSHIVLELVAGRTGFRTPEVTTNGAIDDSRYYK